MSRFADDCAGNHQIVVRVSGNHLLDLPIQHINTCAMPNNAGDQSLANVRRDGSSTHFLYILSQQIIAI